MANKTERNFKLSTLSLNNSISVFILSALLLLFGLYSYRTMPKESFPEIVFPLIYVQTPYAGNTPADIENLITRPLEKEIKGVDGIKDLNSESVQDVSIINVEFNIDVDTEKALQDVKDAVDRARTDLPTDLDQEPLVMDIDLSRIPILNINLSGDYSIDQLVDFAEDLQDEIEELPEISEATITGDKEKEVQINVDLPLLKANQISFTDIENAIASENVNIGAGDILLGNTRRSIRTDAEFQDMNQIKNIIVKHENNNIVYLKDVADVLFTYKEVESFARLGGEQVVSLNVIKKSGENLLNATDKITEILQESKKNGMLPKGLRITTTNDQSVQTRNQISNLENSIISGVILVILVLLFFLGLRNAIFVGLSIPFSMFICFLVLSALGITLNFMVLFGLILALGMLVDNGIVTIENIYRLYEEEGLSKFEASRQGVGEIAVPIISSTATTLAAFFPLLFWDSIIGEFMGFLPKTLIIVLASSLFVALVINPVITATFIKKQDLKKKPNYKRALISAAIFGGLGALFILAGVFVFGNLMLIIAALILIFAYVLEPLAVKFQTGALVKLENLYARTLKWALDGIRPIVILIGTFVLMVVSIMFYFGSNPKVVFFPVNEPNFINVYVEVPLGTDVQATDSVTRIVESKLDEILEPYGEVIESVVTNVGAETASQNDFGGGGQSTPNKARITIAFVEYQYRNGIETTEIQKDVTNQLLGYLPGVTFTVEKEQNGPPVGKPINIEITGEEFDQLIEIASDVKNEVDAANIPGIEGLQIDLETNKPEMLIKIDRERARRLGVSTQQIALVLRTALYGREASKYKEGEDEYPIEIRLKKEYRYDVASLMNQLVTFRSQATGKIVQVPISAVASYEFNNSFNSIKRLDSERLITVYSNVIEGYNETEVNNQIKATLKNFKLPQGYDLKFTGAQQEQDESSAFLGTAMLMAIALISIILVSQFNSLVKPFIIIMTVVFSTIGVFLGLGIFQMDFVVIMTGIGIVSLAGIVVNNGIVLIDFIELSRSRQREAKGVTGNHELTDEDLRTAIELAGKVRLRPVLLTAITTVLGLLPLAVGLNIDFIGMLSSYDPNIYFGGDNAVFWSPMAWTVIFGLVFATFLTLVVVPVMYLIFERLTRKSRELFNKFAS
ncbi:cation/multidrug efflux pump [Owenweeksia hongkongensis DSM 17368]|uniref:Cation/multidrug efflux pump n=1 Tax=Owenweeksia hongkongensis (strain DSM 17368 / CIP 108786 / JCM 12287 / NRRL B-23963 / UST20020801) TaxID=926562 RepID=G8R4Q0_OWEHD|nr:efflux RND transporter permease subunit [Owenweeksia hongkongensis]AEV33174.1 cation/multidrug efflux pump [Owenweeksia hongkongensis DSM 17368]